MSFFDVLKAVDTIPREFSGEKLVFVFSLEKARQSGLRLLFITFLCPLLGVGSRGS
jgi:hypothetical protein